MGSIVNNKVSKKKEKYFSMFFKKLIDNVKDDFT